MLRKDSTEVKWTATDNMFVDGGTELMKLDHMAIQRMVCDVFA